MDRVDAETNRYLDGQVAVQEADETIIKAIEDGMFERPATLFDALDSMTHEAQSDLLELAKAFKEMHLDTEDDYVSLKSYSETVGMIFLTAIEAHVREAADIRANK